MMYQRNDIFGTPCTVYDSRMCVQDYGAKCMLMMIDPVHYALYIFLLSFRFTLLQYLNIRDIILLCGSIWAQSNSFDWQLHVTFISGCFTLLTDSYYWAFLDFIRGGQNVKIRCISSCNAPKKHKLGLTLTLILMGLHNFRQK